MGPDGDLAFGAFFTVVAHNSTDNEYLVVWNARDDSGTLANGEVETFGQLLDATGAEIGTNDFRISEMGPDGDPSFICLQGRVAHSPATNEYLVVWRGEDDIPGEGEEEVFGQVLDAAGLEVGEDDFRISDMGLDGDGAFDAGSGFYGPSLALGAMDREFLVVWEGDDTTDGEFEIFGQRLSVATTPLEDLVQLTTDVGVVVNGNQASCTGGNLVACDVVDKLEDAAAKAQSAVDKLDEGDNLGAIGEIEGAVGDLEAALGIDPAQDPTILEFMDRLAGIARQLAADVLAQALACDPAHPDNAVAQQSLDDGDVEREAGTFKDAVGLYKDAKSKAEGVLADC